MEAVILTKDQYMKILEKLDELGKNLEKTGKQSNGQFMDNQDFIMMMKISKRTAQSWRDEGKIAFSQIGGKIYYKITDVEELLKAHYIKSTQKK